MVTVFSIVGVTVDGETIAYRHNLESGRTKSCGCLRIELGNRIIREARYHQARMSKRVKIFKRGAA